eukprot:Pgem_evm1s9177
MKTGTSDTPSEEQRQQQRQQQHQHQQRHQQCNERRKSSDLSSNYPLPPSPLLPSHGAELRASQSLSQSSSGPNNTYSLSDTFYRELDGNGYQSTNVGPNPFYQHHTQYDPFKLQRPFSEIYRQYPILQPPSNHQKATAATTTTTITTTTSTTTISTISPK